MATGPAPLPPTTILTTKSISQSAAHDFLAAYLERANTDPALQPSAGITEHGPVSRTTSAAPNLILHNLKRVQAGLAGEVLGRDLSLSNLNGVPGSNAAAADASLKDPAAGDWEDAKKFEQEGEGDYEGDYDADVAGAGGAEVPMEVDTAEGGVVDKEERKKKKKERRLAEKRAKAKADADEA